MDIELAQALEEIEEYKDNTRIKDKNTYVGFPNERISELQDYEGNYIDISERIIKVFKDGAEFGYNKANEWHKQDIDDIYDCIAEDWSVRYFICIMKDKSRVTAMGNCDEDYEGGVGVNLFFDHDDAKYHMDDIVWWKEIVPPKESE